MRNWYQNTTYDMGAGMAAGPFGSPGRDRSASGVVGNWERPIAISRTIVSYVLQCRGWLPSAVGGVVCTASTFDLLPPVPTPGMATQVSSLLCCHCT